MLNHPRLQGVTLARKLLAAIVALSVGLTATVAIAAFVIFLDRSEHQKIADLDLYARARARTERGLFDAMTAQHAGASEAFAYRLPALSDAQAAAQFDREFPLRRDGTRRSAPRLFGGVWEASGEQIHGLGAFLAHGDQMTPADKHIFLTAAHVVAQNGQASHSRLDNFFFFTPESRMVMFGPDRADKLRFYRETAPASLDFSRVEMAQLMKPANNPARLTRCTSLQRPMWSKAADLSIACLTPVYVGDRFVGAWGTTMPMGAYLDRAIRDAPQGATNLILSDKGEVIAYPGFSALGATSQAGAGYARERRTADLVKRIAAQHRPFGVLKSPDGASLVAYGRMEGPGWWFTISTPGGGPVGRLHPAAGPGPGDRRGRAALFHRARPVRPPAGAPGAPQRHPRDRRKRAGRRPWGGRPAGPPGRDRRPGPGARRRTGPLERPAGLSGDARSRAHRGARARQ
jgi:hypothetical protein